MNRQDIVNIITGIHLIILWIHILKNRELKFKKRTQELENQDYLVLGIYGTKGAGKTYYERTKNKTKRNKRTRRNSRSS